MAYEPDRPFAEDGDMISIKQNLEAYGYTIAASLDREKHKIGALSEEKLKEIKVLADVILIDTAAEFTPEKYASKATNTPFTGWNLKGEVRKTICGGRIVYEA